MKGPAIMSVAATALLTASAVCADPIVLRPAASIEFVDFAPVDGLGLESFVSENIALGPGAESRVFYEFALDPLRDAPRPVVFSVVRRLEEFSECALLAPCPDLTRLDVFGYEGTGAITAAAYNAGTRIASISALPGRGHTLQVDVTDFVSGLLAGNAGFAGFALRAGSIGALGTSDARLSATPEPASLTLLALGSVGAFGRMRRRLRR